MNSPFNVEFDKGIHYPPFYLFLSWRTLHVAIEDVVAHGFFKDLWVGDGGARISHLFYVDDVMLGEWDDTNITNLIIILNCFYLVSGLRLNLHKSKLYEVGVALEDVEQCSGVIGCSTASLPFTYLGLPVGSNMNIKSNWDELILKVQKKLANWKIMLLSIRGRLTLLKPVLGSLDIYFMSLFKCLRS
ncbi:hypothetical protein Tco_1178199 [Tanacetum coccineum]